MKTQVLKILLPLCLMVWPALLRSQTIVTSAGSVSSCPGTIVVAVTVTNCNNIGAISLKLDYNSSILTYQGYQNLHSQLTTGLLSINSTGSSVIFSWANTTAANIGNGTLVEFIFNAVAGASSLNWDTQVPGNCEYSDINMNVLPASFVNGTATIYQIPQINIQPVDQTVLVGFNASFSLSASGTGLSYLWQVSIDGGSIWSDLSNNATYSGVTTATLSISNAQLTMNGYKYRCRITGTCPPVLYSNVVTLTVVNPITTTLPTLSFCPGSIIVSVTVTNFTSVASFSLTFSYDTAKLTYTGYQSINPALSGGTSVINASGGKVYISWSSTTAATFGSGTIVKILFNAVTSSSNLTWDTSTPGACEYMNLGGSILASVFVNGSLTIYGIPSIVTHPVNRTIAKGQNTTFSITASGSGLSYQWQVRTNGGGTWVDLTNTGYYSNVTQPTMNITNAQLELNGYQYRCKVTGTCSPVAYSNAGLLTVLPNVITTCQSVSVCPGAMVIAITVTDFIGVGAFSLALNYNSSILTYTGYQNLHANLAGGTFASNASGGTVYLTWSRTTTATITSGQTLIELLFNGVSGSSSLLWDTGIPGNCEYNDANGQVIFSTWNNGNATVYKLPLITVHPVNKTIYSGGSTSFSVTATGTGLGYIWQVSVNGGSTWNDLTNTIPYSDVLTPTLTINPASQSMNGYLYRCRVSGTCPPSVNSNSAQLTVTAPAISTYLPTITNSCTGNLIVPITVVNCTDVGGISLVLAYDTTKLTFDTYESLHSELSSGILALHADAGIVRFSWASTNDADIGSGTLVKYRFKTTSGISTSLNLDVSTPGNCEYSFIDGSVATSFYYNSTISVLTNPLVVSAGNDTTISSGGTAQLHGSASGGTPSYTYSWTPTNGLNNPFIPNPLATPSTSTYFTLTVYDNATCSGSEGVMVNVAGVPATRVLQNITIGSGQNLCYDATQTITVAGGGTYFTVQNGGSVVLIAGQSIQMLPGTSVNLGGSLDAYITTTGQYCASLPPGLENALQPVEEIPIDVRGHQSFFYIYPNPTKGDITVELLEDHSRTLYISIHDIYGKIVVGEKLFVGKKQEFLIFDKRAGIYIVRVYNEAEHHTEILIKL